MTETRHEGTVTRRSFIRNLTLSVVAATAAGSSLALLTKKREAAPATLSTSIAKAPSLQAEVPVPAVRSVQAAVSAPNDAAQALARLAESQAENVRLQAALDAALRDLESLRLANSNESAAVEELSLQLAEANNEIGLLAGLVTLYEELESVDVGETIQNGMAAVSSSISELLDHTPGLSESIERGQMALAEVENHLPLLENGRLWLEAQSQKMGSFYETVETVLQNVLESVGTFLEMVENWFANIRKWLPFGIDEKAAEVISALSTLVAETPNTVSGLDTYLAQPLDQWLAREEDEPRLQRRLIKPLRDEVLSQATETITRAQAVQTVYQEQMGAPVAERIAAREATRQRLEAYRQQHQV